MANLSTSLQDAQINANITNKPWYVTYNKEYKDFVVLNGEELSVSNDIVIATINADFVAERILVLHNNEVVSGHVLSNETELDFEQLRQLLEEPGGEYQVLLVTRDSVTIDTFSASEELMKVF